MQVKGTGIANTCPVVEGAAAPLKLSGGDYKLGKMCLEPTSFTVKEESQFKGGEDEFVGTKLMTRLTYTLDEVNTLNPPPLPFCEQRPVANCYGCTDGISQQAPLAVWCVQRRSPAT